MKKHWMFAAALVSAFVLVGCGGGGGSTPIVAADDLSVDITADTAAALSSEEFTFSGGVPDFGTTAATTVAFSGTSTTPAFSIEADGKKATGITTFGSCIFNITESDFADSHPLGKNKTIEIDPCDLAVKTGGVVASGGAQSTGATLRLGSTTSEEVEVAVTVAPGGQVTVNNTPAGTVKTEQGSGGS